MLNGIFSSAYESVQSFVLGSLSLDRLGAMLRQHAMAGNTPFVRTLLTYPISEEYRSQALMGAYTNNHFETMQTILDYSVYFSQNTSDIIYQNAASQGHVQVLRALCPKVHDSYIIKTAFKNALLNRHDLAVEELLIQREHSEKFLGKILVMAAGYDNLAIVQKLLAEHALSEKHLGKALFASVNPGPGLIENSAFSYLLRHAGRRISSKYKGEALQRAATWGCIEHMRELINTVGNDITETDKKEALLFAFLNIHFNFYQEMSNLTGMTLSSHEKGDALVLAASNPLFYSDSLLPLLQLGNQIPARHKGIALQIAIENENTPAVSTLLLAASQEISPEALGEALITAAKFGKYSYIDELFTQAGNRLLAKDKQEALFWASTYNHSVCVDELLTIEPTLNKGNALYQAAAFDHFHVVECLLTVGQSPTGDDEGLALLKAAEENHFEIVDRLRPRANIPLHYHGEALIMAVRKGHYHSFEKLLISGHLISTVDKIATLTIIVQALVRTRCQVVTNTYRAMLDELQKSILAHPLPDEHQAVALKVIAEVSNPAVLNQYKRAQPSERVELDEANDAEVHQDKRARNSQ